MPRGTPLLTRFLGKFMLDILPAALASAIGGFLFTQYQWGQAPAPASERHAVASAEIIKLVRDEHALIVNFLNARLAAEKARLAVEEKARRGASADMRDPPAAARHDYAVVKPSEAKTPPPTRPLFAAAAPRLHAPMVIAQAQPASAPPAEAGVDSPFLKTIGLKDHVIAATEHMVTAIGAIPSWIAALGDRLGGQSISPPSASHLIGTTS